MKEGRKGEGGRKEQLQRFISVHARGRKKKKEEMKGGMERERKERGKEGGEEKQ